MFLNCVHICFRRLNFVKELTYIQVFSGLPVLMAFHNEREITKYGLKKPTHKTNMIKKKETISCKIHFSANVSTNGC